MSVWVSVFFTFCLLFSYLWKRELRTICKWVNARIISTQTIKMFNKCAVTLHRPWTNIQGACLRVLGGGRSNYLFNKNYPPPILTICSANVVFNQWLERGISNEVIVDRVIMYANDVLHFQSLICILQYSGVISENLNFHLSRNKFSIKISYPKYLQPNCEIHWYFKL